ncbi:semaphorin-4A [Chanos chanos]|uniref:Semaphorin-4A n=1 Tax=Chanos chanos TaxID=29144 RepID=A0A6J2W0Y0_CHACN|nr:semaphorin-4A-like [Chanos chanos]
MDNCAAGSAGRFVARFTRPDVRNTTTLLLSAEGDTLFVGARDAVLSLDVSQPDKLTLINKKYCFNYIRVLQFLNSTHLYVCGTSAFKPHDTIINTEANSNVKIEGKEAKDRCPHHPNQRNTAVAVDGELYMGTVSGFWGNKAVISRYFSKDGRKDISLENSLGSLIEPTFISSSFIPSEGKVYFFLTETAKEYSFMDQLTVPRVAQVCTDDNGGMRILQKHWTTFAKAQLVCKPEKELPFGVLEDMVTLPNEESPDDTLFYGVFRSQWSLVSEQSAVCAFRLGDIKAVFSDEYRTLDRSSNQWSSQPIKHNVLGKCGSHNDNDLNIVKTTFLTARNVEAVGQKVTLMSTEHLYSRMAAQTTQAANGHNFTVLFLLSESGFLHKVVLLESGPHIIEEIQVFKPPQIMKNILLSVTKGVVFVGTSDGVSRVPVSNCSFYLSCSECVLAQDPFCGWDPATSVCTTVSSIQANLAQDVEHGNITEQCKDLERGHSMTVPRKTISVVLSERVILPCQSRSKLATLSWRSENNSIDQKNYIQSEDGSLMFLASPATLGTYSCISTERGFHQILAIFSLSQSVSPRAMVSPGKPNHNTPNSEPGTPSETGQTTDMEIVPESDIIGGHNEESVDSETTDENKEHFHSTVGGAASDPKTTGQTQNSGLKPVTEAKSYYRELVTVTLLFCICLCMLLFSGFHWWKWRRISNTGPQLIPVKEFEVKQS